MICNLSSTGLNGTELIYLDSRDNSIIPTSDEIQFPVNDTTYVKIDSSGLNVYNSTGNLIGWWNVKDKIKTLISLIYLDALNDTVIASSNEIKFNFDNDILVKINEFGLFVFENDEWWNVKDKIKTPIDLTTGKGAFGDKQAFNVKTMLIAIPKLLLPMFVYAIGAGVYLTAALYNHSCDPRYTVQYTVAFILALCLGSK